VILLLTKYSAAVRKWTYGKRRWDLASRWLLTSTF
jgi:hypothetical protein